MKSSLLLMIIFAFISCSENGSQSKKLRTTKEVTGKEAREIDVPVGHEHKEVWTCPMHPQVRKDGPGKCPICHMDLVKVDNAEGDDSASEDSPEGHATIKLSPARQQLIGVETGIVVKRPLFKTIEAPGRVAFDPDLFTAQTEFIEAIRQRERVKNAPVKDVIHSATRMVESARLRLKVLGLSDDYIDKLARGGVAGSGLLIPKAGEKLWVYAEVFEMDLPNISPGHPAVVSGSSLGNKKLTGKVVSVDRVLNPNTRTARVRILIPDTKASLRPESYLDVSILSPLGEEIAVPFTAVLDTGKEAWVFVVEEDKTFKPQLITIKERAGDMVAVASGVVPGQKIVTSANFLIDSESRLKGVLQESMSQKLPDCPEGQFWHGEMSMCMDKP